MDSAAEAAARSVEMLPGRFFGEILGMYRQHFILFIRFLVPATIFGYIAVISAGDKAQEIVRRLPQGPAMLEHHVELIESFLIRFAGWMVSWVVYCFAFAGISIAVRDIHCGTAPKSEQALE